MTTETILELRPEEQYAEYLADRVRLAFSYTDWYEMQFNSKPAPVSPEMAQVIISAAVSKKHS